MGREGLIVSMMDGTGIPNLGAARQMGQPPEPTAEQKRAAYVHLAIQSFGEGGCEHVEAFMKRVARIQQFMEHGTAT